MITRPRVTIDRLNVTFRQHHVLVDLSAQFSSGETIRIAGENGSGKTTLLRVISGLLTDYTGTVTVDSGVTRPGDRLPLVSSPPHLFPYLTVGEHLVMSRQFSRDAGRTTPEVDTEELGLAPVVRSLAEELSLGQRQRLSLAILLLTGSDIWLLDEPFNGLDDHGIELLRRHIARHAESGGITLAATHHAAHLAGLAVSTLELGRVGSATR